MKTIFIYATNQLFAAPAYIKRAPQLRNPADLAAHDALISDERQISRQWQLTRAQEKITVNVKPVLCSNDNPTLAMSAVAGHGIALLPHFVGESYCRLGLLQPLLAEWREASVPLYLVFPHRAAMPRKYRAFIDFIQPALQARLSQDL